MVSSFNVQTSKVPNFEIKERTKYQNDEEKNKNVTEEEAKNRSYKTRKKKKEQNDSSLA